jgi:hypothetical protein
LRRPETAISGGGDFKDGWRLVGQRFSNPARRFTGQKITRCRISIDSEHHFLSAPKSGAARPAMLVEVAPNPAPLAR